jgi:hypothetical protein
LSKTSPTILVYEPAWKWVQPSLGNCQITLDRALIKEADAVVFHIPTSPDLRDVPKYPGQIWVAWSMESDINYPQLANIDFMKRFDLTMTYRFDSDIPVVYFGPSTLVAMVRPPMPKTESVPAVYVASNSWDRSGRLKYIRELMRHLPIDSYGKSLNNKPIPEDRGRETTLEIYSRYKFTLAFENSRSRDYVTEKFFNPLMVGSVPVYYGAPNIADFAPGDHCFVDVQQFQGPRDLAEHLLRIAADEREYESYFAWKERPLSKILTDMVERVSEGTFSRLCAKLRAAEGAIPASADPIQQVARWLEGKRKGC